MRFVGDGDGEALASEPGLSDAEKSLPPCLANRQQPIACLVAGGAHARATDKA